MTRSPHLTHLPFVRYTTLTEVSNSRAETLAEALVAGRGRDACALATQALHESSISTLSPTHLPSGSL